MNELIGEVDIAFVVLDSLRYDVAEKEFAAGHTPNIKNLCPNGWEKRHSPGSFTYSAHHAFFAGFLPTPADPGASNERLFATEFAGSETTGKNTRQFPEASIIEGLRADGYYTVCVGGVGFFNKETALSRVFPSMFDESFWSIETGVTDKDSFQNQIDWSRECMSGLSADRRLFYYLNISAIHQPNCHYIEGKDEDDLETHAAALRYVDSCFPDLVELLTSRGDVFLIACSDHGTLYGEEGFVGHRVGHEHVYTVPYFHCLISK